MNDYIYFLGTAGGRYSVFNQIRASGGIWMRLSDTNLLIDPGPGSLVRLIQSGLSAKNLDAICLSHRHLDHSGDINNVIESMTSGGRMCHGAVLAPCDAWDDDPVILKYNRKNFKNIRSFEGGSYQVGSVTISTPMKLNHTVANFALHFSGSKHSVGYISDTLYFDKLKDLFHNIDILILNTVFMHARDGIYHLSTNDIPHIIKSIKPKKTVITHFSTEILDFGPDNISKQLSQTGLEVIAAEDNMKLEL